MPVVSLDWIWPVLAGPFVGSFLGVLIRRLPNGRAVVLARSHCETCGRTLGARELMPLASWLWLRGRCRGCGNVIPPFHVAVELAAMLVALSAAWVVPNDPAVLWAGCLLGWCLLALAWIDWEHLLLPDVLTLPLIVAGLGATWLNTPDAAPEHAAAALVGFAMLWLVNAAYRRLRGWDGLGAGDAKLFAACGAWMGVRWLGPVLLIAALAGLCIATSRHLAGERLRRDMRLPFGSCLALALWVAWLLSAGLPGPP